MSLCTKLPIGVKGIAEIMEMEESEVRAWPFFDQMRETFKDYNFGMLTKDAVILKLLSISEKCAAKSCEGSEGGYYQYATGIDNAIAAIRICF